MIEKAHVNDAQELLALVEGCLAEARDLGMERVFVLTYLPEFFRRFGFEPCPKEGLPHKIWADCLKCPRFPDCDEVALIRDLRVAGGG